MDDLGNAEVEQLRDAGGRDENIRRFEIAVYDQVLMSVGDGAANLTEKLEPFADRKLTLFRVVIDPLACDVLHDEIRQPVLRSSAVEQASNVRVVERSKNLAFMLETAED